MAAARAHIARAWPGLQQCLSVSSGITTPESAEHSPRKRPVIGIAVLGRNRGHTHYYDSTCQPGQPVSLFGGRQQYRTHSCVLLNAVSGIHHELIARVQPGKDLDLIAVI